MDMNVNGRLIKSERRKRAWSQEHLADVTGLGLRTIQRIEKTGAASYESVRALASVLFLEVDELTRSPGNNQRSNQTAAAPSIRRTLAGSTAAIVVALAAVFALNTSWAEQVMLDISISQNNEEPTVGQLLTAEGKDAEIRIDDAIRVVIAPTIQKDGKIFLSAKIYEFLNGEFVLLAEPKLITADNKEAEIRIDADSGASFTVRITPHTSG